jgi:DUF1680 family protein
MPKIQCQADHKTRYDLRGFVRDYMDRMTDQWLLVAPLANPGMLEMFRDRDAPPFRDMVPWAGEFAGKYLTGAVQVLRVTGDARLKAWLREFVEMFIRCQAEDGYLGPWPKDCRLTNWVGHLGDNSVLRWDTWGHYHAMLGLLLWHEETGDKPSLKAATKIADLLCAKYLGEVPVRLVYTGGTEMNLAPVHALCLLYKRTGTQRHLDMALQLVGEFAAEGPDGPLAGDYLRQALAGKEFFQTPKPRWESLHPIMGLVELYWITGEERYREAFEQIWWSIVKTDRHNNGGFTSGEKATGNPYDPGAIETCCTIAWLALSVEMLKLTGNSIVADEIELSTLNSVVGMHSISGRWATYNTPSDGQRRASAHHIVFQARPGTPELNCCSVNSSRGFGLISDWAVLRDEQGIRLNYYGPSEMRVPMGRGVKVALTQKTEYPLAGAIDLTVSPSKPLPFALRLRIPHWSRKTTVKLNGKAVKGVQSGQYLTMERTWKKGDRIQISLDMSLHVWTGDRDCQGRASIYRGPLLLTFDHRYNLHLAANEEKKALIEDSWKNFSWTSGEPGSAILNIPTLDAKVMHCKRVVWSDWLAPQLLVELAAANGLKIRLCDHGSAGEGGTPHVSWLPVTNVPPPMAFSPDNPLRSQRRSERDGSV